MSKTIILIIFLSLPAWSATDVRPTYSKQVMNQFMQKVKKQSSKKDRWASFEAMNKDLESEKIVITNEDQLIYMNSLMVALDVIKEKEFQAGKCKEMSDTMDEKFLPKGISVKNGAKHYQDARAVLVALCK